MNWRFALDNTNNHVSNRELGYLPIPDPSSYPQLADEISDLVRSLRKPSTTIHPEIEGKVSQLYGLNQSEVKRILQSKGVKRNEIQLVLDHLKS